MRSNVDEQITQATVSVVNVPGRRPEVVGLTSGARLSPAVLNVRFGRAPSPPPMSDSEVGSGGSHRLEQ